MPGRARARGRGTKKRPVRARAHAPTPRRIPSVVPHLAVEGAEAAIAFYEKAFGARVENRSPAPDGRVLHASLRIGNAFIMLADIFPGAPVASPARAGSTGVIVHLNLPAADDVFTRAITAGGTVVMPMTDMFWGERYGLLRDPFGHLWSLSRPIRLTNAQREAMRESAMRMFPPPPPPPPPPA